MIRIGSSDGEGRSTERSPLDTAQVPGRATSTAHRCSNPGMNSIIIHSMFTHPAKTPIALFLVALLGACLLGCATPGRPYDDAKVAMIKQGITTEAELLDWFGPATMRSLGPDGAKTLSWRFAPGTGRSADPSGSLEVKLGTNGTVAAYKGAAHSQ